MPCNSKPFVPLPLHHHNHHHNHHHFTITPPPPFRSRSATLSGMSCWPARRCSPCWGPTRRARPTTATPSWRTSGSGSVSLSCSACMRWSTNRFAPPFGLTASLHPPHASTGPSLLQPPLGQPGAARAAHRPLPQPRPGGGRRPLLISRGRRSSGRRAAVPYDGQDAAVVLIKIGGPAAVPAGSPAAGGWWGGFLHAGGNERDAADGGLRRCVRLCCC